MTASAWKTTWLQAGQTTSSPISLLQDLYFSRFQDFKVSRESSSTEDRATDLKELSTRTDLSSADLEILTASQDFPADSALHTSALITNSGVYGSMHCTLHRCANSAAAEVLWWPTGLVTSVHHCNWAPFQHRWWWEKLSINTRIHVKLLRNAPKIDGTHKTIEFFKLRKGFVGQWHFFYTCLTKTKLAKRGLLLVDFPTRLSEKYSI